MTRRAYVLRSALKLIIVALSVWVVISLPQPEQGTVLHYRNTVAVLVGVVIAGKILYDTLFYDRYV